jgi:putative ATPase
MDLFGHSLDKSRFAQPLAERMRPARLEDVIGQAQLLGPGKMLERAVASGALPSMILFGPPGTGKTTLARILAGRVGARLVALSAVQAGVKELRETIEDARRVLAERREKTVLFIDEIHRFNKAQQDALLPHVEAGTVTLIGATTENPSFEVNAALLSRARVVRLEGLTNDDILALLDRALRDQERGLGMLSLEIAEDAKALIAQASQGDARRALTTLELASHLAAAPTPPATARVIDRAVIEEALQKRVLLYDKAGDEHYAVVSAFIKSMRGSDPDAAIYWMTRMLEAGEDPIFVLRRMVIFASEDVGNADPEALRVAVAAFEAVRLVGLPEGTLPMAQAAAYLSLAPKSNTALTSYAAARRLVTEHGALPVPLELRPAPTPREREAGHGVGYKYPHDFTGHYVPAEYLPEKLRGTTIYEPSESGREKALKERLAALKKRST